ncbi:phosphatase PAP2 family protein [Bacillus sp. REN10]|uniref:phosphatase PAP2 family protein n=1 Tax=Bacillus sp. REN10 TaxID=2782541 RepID=UPI00193C5619|nr:phosphatase PAP2 family protein [Bacillus sp. REN10]
MDKRLFWGIQQLSGRCFLIDQWMILISKKARYLFLFILLLKWVLDGPKRRTANTAILSATAGLLVNFLLKRLCFKPRPFMKHKVGILMPTKIDSSFPSKHTLLAFAVSSAIFLRDRMWGRILSYLSGLVGLSRVWVGHHYPSDIVFSALIGTITGIVIHKNTSHCQEADS